MQGIEDANANGELGGGEETERGYFILYNPVHVLYTYAVPNTGWDINSATCCSARISVHEQ